jgi:NADPH:quinone reductase-like Zn-dependent oxidoreductase
MKAVVIRRHGGPEVLSFEDVPTPAPGPGQVLIKIRASGTNANEYWVRQGVKRFDLPVIPGSDAAGTVVAVGEGVSSVEPGDPVVVYCGVSCQRCLRCQSGEEHLCEQAGGFRIWGFDARPLDGSLAEYACLPEHQVVPKPPSLTWEEAASLPLTLVTGWRMLIANARTKPNETVLVRGASGGMGVIGLQIARMLGARTIAVTSSEEKARFIERVGADHVVIVPRHIGPNGNGAHGGNGSHGANGANGGNGSNGHAKSTKNLRDAVRDLTNGHGVDIVFDSVGGPSLMESLKLLRYGGRMVTCGATDGYVTEIEMPYLFIQNKSIIGSTLGTRVELVEALDAVERGILRPWVTRVFPFPAAGEAIEQLRLGQAMGKLVVTR